MEDTPIKVAPAEDILNMCRWTADREDWDLLPEFVILQYLPDEDGHRELQPGIVCVLAGDIHPDDYPMAVKAMAMESVATGGPEKAPSAFMLMTEGWAVVAPPADAPAEYREQFDRDAKERQIHTRSGRREVRTVVAADLTGRSWMLTKYRDTGETTENMFYYLDPDAGGRLPEAVVEIAVTLGDAMKKFGAWDGQENG